MDATLDDVYTMINLTPKHMKGKNSMKKLFALIISLSITLVYLQVPGLASENFPYKTGLIPDSYTEILEYMEPTVETRLTLPESVDKTSRFPTPGDQGQQNSCVGWAVGYAMKSGSEHRKRGWTVSSNNHKFSPAYIYNQINNGEDQGASILDAMDILENQGACTLPYFPYNQNNYTKQPTAIQTANANLYKASDTHTILGINNIKEKIYKNYGVVIGIEVYPDFTNLSSSNSIYDTVSGSKQGNHAICLIGYDDNMGDSGAFKFINSWGTDWGLGGYGWISYDTVKDASTVLNSAIGYYIETSSTDNYIMGDVNNDGTITTADASLALTVSNNAGSVTAAQFVLADVYGDAKISQDDAREILRVAAGQQLEFSLYQ